MGAALLAVLSLVPSTRLQAQGIPGLELDIPAPQGFTGYFREVSFRRGDFNTAASVDISDAIATFVWLFAGGEASTCTIAGDTNNDSAVDLSDGVFSLAYLFRAGADRRDPEVAAAVVSLNRSFFTLAEYPDARSKALYTFYHAYASAHNLLDDQYRKLTERPPKWRKELIEVLMAQQLGDGQWQHRKGADERDPNWATAHALLALRLALD